MTELQRLKKVVKWMISEGYGTTQKEIGEVLGYTNESSFSQILSGKVKTDTLIKKIYNFDRRISKDWLLYGEGEMLKSSNNNEEEDSAPKVVATDEESYKIARAKYGDRLVPEYNAVFHGGVGVPDEPDYLLAHWVIPNAPKDAYIVTMRGESMMPKIPSGAKIMIVPQSFLYPTEIPFGQTFAVAVSDEFGNVTTHVKILRRHTDKEKEKTHWIARSENSNYDDFDIRIENVRFLAIVRGLINFYY